MIRLSMAAAAPLLLLVQPAFALCNEIPMPPPQFDHAPTTDFHDDREAYGQVDAICRHAANLAYQTKRLEGCWFKATSDDMPTRVIPDDIDPGYTDCLIAHENGHINGWASNHPDAQYR